MTSLRLEDVSVERGGRPVVQNVNLCVSSGRWLGLVGANGSGKTSLLRGISGRLALSAGLCLIGGNDFSHSRIERARHVGFAPPVEKLPEAMRVRELLAIASDNIEVSLANVGPLGDALGLGSLLNWWVGDCSAGMRQKVSIAAAFALGHSIVVLDEPFNWLDPVAAFDLKIALRQVVKRGTTLLTSLHDLTTLCNFCDDGALMSEGSIAALYGTQTLRTGAACPHDFEAQTIDVLRAARRHLSIQSID